MATVTILNNPGTYSPASAEIWLNLDSGSSSVSDFKYIIDINQVNPLTSVNTKIGSYKVPPRPSTGNGLFTPNKLLRSKLTYNLQPYINYIENAANSIMKYNFRYGFQYATNDAYTFVFNAGSPYAGKLGLTFPATQSYLIGDIITINKDNKQSNPQYDGTSSVLFSGDVFGFHILITDKTYVTSSVSDVGVITNLYRMVGTTSNFYAYNGTRQYGDIKINYSNTSVFRNDTTFTSFLTNFGNEYAYEDPTSKQIINLSKSIYEYQYETLSFLAEVRKLPIIIDETLYGDIFFKLNLYDVNGTHMAPYDINITSTPSIQNQYRRYDLPVGMANFLESGLIGSASNVGYYNITAVNLVDPVIKASKFYKIVDNCSPYEKNYRIAFLNRDGGFDYFNFNYKSTNSLSVNKTEFKKVLDWNYNIGDRQDTVLAQQANESYIISSDWITEKESNILKELITSPEVYIVQDPWEFYDNQFSYDGSLGLIGKKRHNFKIGDTIKVTQFVGATYPAYDGVHTITTIPDEYNIVTDAPFLGSTPPEGGIVRLDGNIFYPIIITDSSYQVKTKIDNKIFCMTLNFRYANNINLQNS